MGDMRMFRGRITSRSLDFEEETYTATYAYRYGDKLRYINSDWPGDTTYIAYNYDGLGKRRFRNANDQYTWWRWDLGWSAVTQYADTDTDWTVEGFDRFFVPYGHAALAEADVTTTPAEAAYSYLAQDHLGTGRYIYSQAKTETGAVEHYPYGDRYEQSGAAAYHEFTAKPWDEDAGLYYFPYRYYAPMYGYVGGRATVLFDAFGLASSCEENARKAYQTCKSSARTIHNWALADLDRSYEDLTDAIRDRASNLRKWCKSRFPRGGPGQYSCIYLVDHTESGALDVAYASYLLNFGVIQATYAGLLGYCYGKLESDLRRCCK